MHNPRIVVAVATYLTFIHVGHMFVMGYNKEYEDCAARKTAEDAAVYKRRVDAGVTAYVLAFVAALAWLISRNHRADRITYWAVGAIIFFGLAEGIYMAWPKLYRNDPTPEDQERRRRGARLSESVSFIALLAAILAWVFSSSMQPIPVQAIEPSE